MDSGKRKVLVPIFNRAHYGRLRPVLRAVGHHPSLELQVMVAAPAIYNGLWTVLKHSRPRSWRVALPWYMRARLMAVLGMDNRIAKNDFLASRLLADGFQIHSKAPFFIDGGVSETMAKSVGLGIVNIVDELRRLKPDIVFVNADRFEMMALAIAASYLNIPVAHNEAGDVSGTIDESVRHAITKLAHLHFTATEASRRRVLQMGEDSKFVFNVGSPAIDAVKDLALDGGGIAGLPFDFRKEKYLLVLAHPVATMSPGENAEMFKNLTAALSDLAVRTVFLGSNMDAGSDVLGRVLMDWRQNQKPDFVTFVKHLPPDDFYKLLARAACALGNSSSFIREGGYFGTPVVLVGSRQLRRERAGNAIEVGCARDQIKAAVVGQLTRGAYPSSSMFGDGRSGERIADVLATVQPNIQKSFVDIAT